jgi:hypothetical protein
MPKKAENPLYPTADDSFAVENDEFSCNPNCKHAQSSYNESRGAGAPLVY